MSPRTQFLNRSRAIVPFLILALHVVAAVWIVADYRRTVVSVELVAVSALPLAQTTLLAAWAALGRTPSYARAAVLCVGLAAIWYVECRALDWDATDSRSAAHAVMFVVQAALIIVVLAMVRFATWFQCRRRDVSLACRRIQFSLVFVLGWTGALGLSLCLGRMVLERTGWTTDVADDPLFLFGLIVGAFNAMIGLTVLAATARGQRWHVVWQIVLALGLTAVLASSERSVLERLLQRDGNMDTIEWVVQAGFQAAYLLVTLVLLRLTLLARQSESHATGQDTPGLPLSTAKG